ncbi:MAG TPA: penicillin-binding protein 2 [Limnochordales bacterium]
MHRRIPHPLRIRVAVVFLAMVSWAVLAWLRIGWLQIVQGSHYRTLAMEQRYRAENLVPERGAIYDRNGVPLVVTVQGKGVYGVPAAIRDPAGAAAALAPLLNQPAAQLERRLRQDSPSVWLAARVDDATAQAVERLNLPGVYVVQRPQREYPHGTLAADVLGFTGLDNQGLAGLEFQYETILRGVPGRHFSERDPRGRAIPGGRSEVFAAVPGNDLILTLDRVLQYTVEQELAEGVAAARAQYGIALLMRAQTGEILAMAAYPGFDPARYADYLPRAFRNPAVTDQYEPGSTLKVFTAAAALEEGLATIDTVLNGPAQLRIGGGVVHCYNPAGYGRLTLKEAIAVSCNTAFAYLGAEIVGGETLARYLEAFGFGTRLGVDLPAEGTGIVPTPGRVAGEILRWANVSFGQGIAVTPIQLAAAMGAIANGGTLMRPYIVQAVRTPDGRIVETRQPTPLRQVISAETARELTDAMVQVVTSGTGTRARVAGYPVAGKTGTAQIPEDGVYGNKRLASFVGFAPAEAPELVGLVMLYDVQQDNREGGRWAAPVFADILDRALTHLGVPPRS